VDVTPGGVSDPVIVTGGIENLQVEYAIDANKDGAVDSYSSDPAVADLPNALGARVWVLARSADNASGANPNTGRTFVMGDASVTPNAGDRLKRHVFSTYVTFLTPQGALE
jgi:type IV pilus assembly protein PilW